MMGEVNYLSTTNLMLCHTKRTDYKRLNPIRRFGTSNGPPAKCDMLCKGDHQC